MALDEIPLAQTISLVRFAAHEGSEMEMGVECCKLRKRMEWLGTDFESHMPAW